MMRFVRRSKIENYFKNDKSVVQVGELLFVPPPPLLSFIQISFSQKSAPSKKKLHPLERHETKKNDVKKSQMRVEEERKTGSWRQPTTGSSSSCLLRSCVSEKCSDLCLDLHLAGLHRFVDGGVLPA